MKENYEPTLAFIMEHEGSKATNIKGDRGGLTAAYGLTLKTMQTLHLDLDHDGDVDANDVKLVTKEVIDAAFRRYFWDAIGGDNLPAGIDLIAADVAWNSGTAKWRQFLKEGYDDDIDALVGRRIQFYRYQARNFPGQDKFLKGWLNRAEESRVAAKELLNER